MRKAKILLIVPDLQGRGGVTSMVNALLHSEISTDYEFHTLETQIDGLSFQKVWALIRAHLNAVKKISHVDLVHIHTASYNSFRRKLGFMFWCVLLHKKYILHVHGGGFPIFMQNARPWNRRLYSWGLHHAAMIITLAGSFEQAIRQYAAPETLLRVIPNPGYIVDLPEKTFFADIHCILFAGWLEKAKGAFDLLEAFAQAKFPQSVFLAMPGKGKIDELRQRAEVLGIIGNVILPGWQREAQMKKWFEKADIFVLPSYTEGMPMVLLEAMAYGVPIITTPVGGIPDMLPECTKAYLHQPGDVDTLRKLLMELAQSVQKRQMCSIAEQQHYRTYFSGNIVFSKIAQCYKEFLPDIS